MLVKRGHTDIPWVDIPIGDPASRVNKEDVVIAERMSLCHHVGIRIRVIVRVRAIGRRPTPGCENEDWLFRILGPDLCNEVQECLGTALSEMVGGSSSRRADLSKVCLGNRPRRVVCANVDDEVCWRRLIPCKVPWCSVVVLGCIVETCVLSLKVLE
jgi:hypothetical protein